MLRENSKICKLMIKGGETGTESEKRESYMQRRLQRPGAYPAWQAFPCEKKKRGEGRGKNCFLFTVWTGGPKGRDHYSFDKADVGKSSHSHSFNFFICSFCCKQFFCVSVFPQTLFFLLAYDLFQCLQPLQMNLLQNSATPPPPPPPPLQLGKKIMVRP